MGCFGDELGEGNVGRVKLQEELDAWLADDLGDAKREVDDFDLLGVRMGDVSFGIGISTALRTLDFLGLRRCP